jgi:hypothetical protein
MHGQDPDGVDFEETRKFFWLEPVMHRESSLGLRILREGQSAVNRMALFHALVDCGLFTEHPIRDWDVFGFRKHGSDILAISPLTIRGLSRSRRSLEASSTIALPSLGETIGSLSPGSIPPALHGLP